MKDPINESEALIYPDKRERRGVEQVSVGGTVSVRAVCRIK